MKTQTVIDRKTRKTYTEVQMEPQELSHIIEKFAQSYYAHRKDPGTVTVKQLVKDIIKAEPEIKFYGEYEAEIEEIKAGITQ